MTDPEARKDRKDPPAHANAAAVGAAEAAAEGSASADVEALVGIGRMPVPSDVQPRFLLLDVLIAMELAVAGLPETDTFCQAFRPLCQALRNRLGLP